MRPGLHLDVFMHRSSRKLLECSRRLLGSRPFPPPPLFVAPFVKPRTKWKIGRTTTRSPLALSFSRAISLSLSFFSVSLSPLIFIVSFFVFFFVSSTVTAADSPSLRRGGSPCAALNSMCQQIRPLRSEAAYPSRIIRSKGRFSAAQGRSSCLEGRVTFHARYA